MKVVIHSDMGIFTFLQVRLAVQNGGLLTIAFAYHSALYCCINNQDNNFSNNLTPLLYHHVMYPMTLIPTLKLAIIQLLILANQVRF